MGLPDCSCYGKIPVVESFNHSPDTEAQWQVAPQLGKVATEPQTVAMFRRACVRMLALSNYRGKRKEKPFLPPQRFHLGSIGSMAKHKSQSHF